MRDPSGTYTVPVGTDGVPNTTILSSNYNTFVHDVESDLNVARPIVAGGTGATSASSARTSLSTERAAQLVTNFDTHIWEPGSFYAASGAGIGGPTANACSGIVYLRRDSGGVLDQANLTVEARDLITGLKYSRRRVTGTWVTGSWILDTGVSKTGDSMSGDLVFDNALTASPKVKFSTTGDLLHPAAINKRADGLLYFVAAEGASGSTPMTVTNAGGIGAANITVTGNGFKPGGGPWTDSSDARIKNIIGEFTRSVADIKQLTPVLYTYVGNDTREAPAEGEVAPYASSPHYTSAKAGTEYVGLIAQDIEGPFPKMVHKSAGYINGAFVRDLRTVDTAPLVFALVNAVKELAARVEALEAAK